MSSKEFEFENSRLNMFGLLYQGGKVWAELVPNVETKTLLPLIKKGDKKGQWYIQALSKVMQE